MPRAWNTALMDDVREALTNCEPASAIESRLATAYDVAPRMMRRYIERVFQVWSDEAAKISTEDRRIHLIVRQEALYREAVKRGHLKVASSVLAEIAKLAGLTPQGAAVAINIDGGSFTPDEMRQRIAELRAPRELPPGIEGDGRGD